MTRIFEVELAHRRFGLDWAARRVVAKNAREAISTAEKKEPGTYAMGVRLVAEAD